MTPTAAAVRATVERGAHDSIGLEQIGGLVRELLTQAWYAADCPPVDVPTLVEYVLDCGDHPGYSVKVEEATLFRSIYGAKV